MGNMGQAETGHSVDIRCNELLVDVSILRQALCDTGIPDESNILGVDIDSVVSEFVRYVSCYDRSVPDIERKVVHSLRVAALCRDIAGCRIEEGHQDAIDVGAETLAGLLHDVGRFPQWAMHAAYRDYANGCDHGCLGYRLLSEFGMVDRFVERDMLDGKGRKHLDMVLQAIRVHNQWMLPDDLDVLGQAYADDLRDADIIDILDISASRSGMPHDPRAICTSASPAVMASIRDMHTVDRTKMRNDTDIVISRLALVFAVKGRRSREILAEHASWDGYLAKCTISGAACEDVIEAMGAIHRHLACAAPNV